MHNSSIISPTRAPSSSDFDIKQLLALIFGLDRAYSVYSKKIFIHVSLQIKTIKELRET